jgi:hypothetical protein
LLLNTKNITRNTLLLNLLIAKVRVVRGIHENLTVDRHKNRVWSLTIKKQKGAFWLLTARVMTRIELTDQIIAATNFTAKDLAVTIDRSHQHLIRVQVS